MPRSIIDVESSRPIHRRRLVLRAIVIAAILLLAAVLALRLLHGAPGAPQSQGKIGAGRNLNQLALKETSCFVV